MSGSKTADTTPHPQSPYRDVFNTPGIMRVHDFQRLVSYGVAIAVSLIVDLPRWRTTAVLVIAVVMFGAAATRLISGQAQRPYLLAQIDQLAAGTVIALLTGSVVITSAALIFISGAIAATFRTDFRVASVSSAATALPPVVLALLVNDGGARGDAAYWAGLVLIAVMLALAAFILGLFTLQTRQLRSELRRRESQLSAVLDVTPVVLAAVNPDGDVTTLAGSSPVWEAHAGATLTDRSAIADLVAAARHKGRSTADVTFADRTFNVTCDSNGDGGALLTAYDVTVQTQARERLEAVVRSKDQFIAAVSHELRTPLASVLGFSELLRERMAPSDPLEPMMIEVADQSAEMAAIIDDLLIAARASFESVPTEPHDVNLAAEVAGVVETLGSRISRRPEAQLADVIAFADPIRVRQIIRNLLTNADRYGGGDVHVTTQLEGGEAVLRVLDSGDPLPPERREAIFEPYESSGPVGGQPAAIGLGLAVSRTLAELMGGSLTYDHDGEWSIFELRLTRYPVQLARPANDR